MAEFDLKNNRERLLIFGEDFKEYQGWMICIPAGLGWGYCAWCFYLAEVIPLEFLILMWLCGAAAFLAGLANLFHRVSVRIDLENRTWEGRKGYLPNPKKYRGSLDELQGVVLTVSNLAKKGLVKNIWEVQLPFPFMGKLPYQVIRTSDETKTRTRFIELARKLQVPAIDRTGAEDKITPWQDLDQPLLVQDPEGESGGTEHPLKVASGTLSPGAPGNRLHFRPEDNLTHFSKLSLFLAICSGGWILLHVNVLASSLVLGLLKLFNQEVILHLFKENEAGLSDPKVIIYSAPFIPALLFWLVDRGRRQTLFCDGKNLFCGYTVLGKEVRVRSMPVGEVREVAIKPVTSRVLEKRRKRLAKELVITSRRMIFRVGNCLKEEELARHRQTVLAMLGLKDPEPLEQAPGSRKETQEALRQSPFADRTISSRRSGNRLRIRPGKSTAFRTLSRVSLTLVLASGLLCLRFIDQLLNKETFLQNPFIILFYALFILTLSVWLVVRGARQTLFSDNKKLYYANTVLGKEVGLRSIPLDKVQEVAIRPMPDRRNSDAHELVILSDLTSFHIGGGLEKQGLHRHRQTVLAMLGR